MTVAVFPSADVVHYIICLSYIKFDGFAGVEIVRFEGGMIVAYNITHSMRETI